MDRLADWVALVDGLYPEVEAARWDATGLQVGDFDDPVSAVLVCLDVSPATLGEAADAGADLVLSHHPLLFRPLARLTGATAPGRLALAAARRGIAVLAAHTNLDVAALGTTDPIAALLDLRDPRPLRALPLVEAPLVKLVTFVPADAAAAVLSALAASGAGVIGEYDRCSFRAAGTGTFRPSARAHPVVGERGRVNEVAEDRLEAVVPRHLLGGAVRALRDAHPYEEVAFDVYPLLDAEAACAGKGFGRVGDLVEPMTLRELADRLAEGLPAPHLRVAGNLDASVRRVAACGGAGDSLIGAALAAGADCYVTGDLRHHVTLDALTAGMAVVDAGHGATEAAALPGLLAALTAEASRRGLRARLVPSGVPAEPWARYEPPSGRAARRDSGPSSGGPA